MNRDFGSALNPARTAPIELLVGPAERARVIPIWFRTTCVVAGAGGALMAIVLGATEPGLPHFRAVSLVMVALLLIPYGLTVPAQCRRWPKGAVVFTGLLTVLLVPLMAFLVGPALSTSVTQGVVVSATSITVLFPRRQAVCILVSSLLGVALVYGVEGGDNFALVRTTTLVVQTALYAALMFWFVEMLFRLSEQERTSRQEAESTRVRLAAANQRRRNFLEHMSHELRTPLNAIIGFSDLLRLGLGGQLNEKQREYVADIASSGRHLGALVDDLLDVGRVETGEFEISSKPVSLPALVQRAVALFRSEAGERGVGLEVTWRGTSETIVADERRVTQILLNLLSNAVRFSPTGGTVEVLISGDLDRFEVLVVDHGPGVDPADADRIFHAFEQGEARHTGTGTGLGLTVARQLAESHGGSLSLSPTPGGGASFALELPASPHGDPDPPTWLASKQPPTASYAAEPAILDDPSALEGLLGRRGLKRVRAVLVGIAAIAETAGVGALLFLPNHPHLGWWPWGGVAGIGFGLCMLLPNVRLGATELYVFTLGAVVVVALFLLSVHPPLTATLATILIMEVLAACAWFRLSRAVIVGLVFAALYGFVLAHQPGNDAPVARWILSVSLAANGAFMARWLLRLLPRLVASDTQARHDLELTNGQLVLASRHRGEFLATMSHELRTPLNAIIGFASALRQEIFGPLAARPAEYVHDIERAGRSLLELINDTLDVAKMEGGHVVLATQPCLPREVVAGAVVAVEAEAADRRVAITEDLHGLNEPMEVDAGRVARSLESILLRAVTVTDPGGTVEVRTRRADGWLIVDVSDQGPAIDPSQEQFFAAFEDVGGTLAKPASRMGLVRARMVAQLHGGELCFEKRDHSGTCFTLMLPVRASDARLSLQPPRAHEVGAR